MGRFVFTLVVLAGIGYGGWMLLRPEKEGPDLSGETARVDPRLFESTASGPEATEPEKAPLEELHRKLLEAARTHLDAAKEAGTRGEALAEKDRARRLLSRLLMEAPGESAEELKKQLGLLNEEVLFSEEPLEGTSFLYTVKPGDRLWTLCYRTFPREKKVKIEPGFLLWVNGLSDPTRIREGQILKVPMEALGIYIRKSARRLLLLLGGVYLKEYPIGIGAMDKTPEGEFEIETKIQKPAWYAGGKRIPFGSPDNPLGSRWLGFKRTRRAAGYGIHGTDEPETIGKAESEGCVRMLNADVEELFEWVPRGTKVTIVR